MENKINWHEVHSRYNAGDSCETIAKDVGSSASTVNYQLKLLGTKMRPSGGSHGAGKRTYARRSTSRNFDWDEALRLREEEHLSFEKIGELVGANRNSVIRAITKLKAGEADPLQIPTEQTTHLERELLEVKDKHRVEQAKLKQAYRDETLLKVLRADLKEQVAAYPFITR